MEYIVVIFAAMLAGIGTGLVGLSAATAMVPLLIVLCPTFRGEHGAFMATAIALASDILGSAVTAGVYAKNKKIDLKHGWLMLVCIILMCTLGSVTAFYTHQTVLGNFSLFLCVAIGIRFLIKPDSKEKDTSSGKAKLSLKEIVISLFFGITIGFGTGFFGSGGGMMMLIVFTAMLGYDRKTAVGTSTFIMTFTALIASISHIMMEPEIIMECWDYLLISILTATVFSLISAKFANKVNAKVVGLTTGVILLLLGLAMILINNIEKINKEYLFEFLELFGIYMAYIAIFAMLLIILRFTTKVPDYVFRKLLHLVAFSSILPLIFCTDNPWLSVAVEIAFLVIIIIALRIFEPFSFYKKLFVEKGKHEVLVSFILLFSLMTLLIVIFWGVLGEKYKYIVATSIMAWGPGDGVAAIVGKKWGKHKLQGKYIEGIKSLEGTLGMGVCSFACTLGVLLWMSELSWLQAVGFSAVIAPVAALTELFTKKGLDTITVPIVTCLILCFNLFI